MNQVNRLLRVAATALIAASTFAASAGEKGSFQFTPKERPALKVWYTLPDKAGKETPIVFALHGMTRTAEATRDAWAPAANERGMIVVTPEFDTKSYPKAAQYNLGNTQDGNGKAIPADQWTYRVIEELFDEMKKRTGSTASEYSLYGHSAGAQFAHRLLLQLPKARVKRVISANAGYYVMPDEGPFPYGMKASGISPEQECRAYGVPMTVLLGEQDNDPAHHQLNNTPDAKAQGAHRLARGETFFSATKKRAAALKCKFAWELKTVPGVAHEFAKMAVAAAKLLP